MAAAAGGSIEQSHPLWNRTESLFELSQFFVVAHSLSVRTIAHCCIVCVCFCRRCLPRTQHKPFSFDTRPNLVRTPFANIRLLRCISTCWAKKADRAVVSIIIRSPSLPRRISELLLAAFHLKITNSIVTIYCKTIFGAWCFAYTFFFVLLTRQRRQRLLGCCTICTPNYNEWNVWQTNKINFVRLSSTALFLNSRASPPAHPAVMWEKCTRTDWIFGIFISLEILSFFAMNARYYFFGSAHEKKIISRSENKRNYYYISHSANIY